ncbi:nuclear transport factor 2 family protein [Algoriphagus lacus]|nr:nuclear transport factor 2 family protein [Algoriphagus lacus]
MTEKEQILICEAKFLRAMASGDLALLDSLLDSRLVFHIPSGQFMTKEMDLENFRSVPMKMHQISSEEPIISVFEGVSIVSVVVHLNAEYSGKPVQGKFRHIRIWKKSRENAWKVIGGSGIMLQ